jgi:hypothetical protein
MLTLRDTGVFPPDMSPEEIQAILERYGAWSARLRGTGHKLFDSEGKVVVRKEGGLAVTDGPYVESREVIGGYYIIEADDYETALKLVEDSPHLDFGSIEIRRVEI